MDRDDVAPAASNYATALSAEVARLRAALDRIIKTPGNDAERLKRIAREELEQQ